MIKRLEDIPETIWLQWANDDGEPLHPDEQTWCRDKIYAHDVRYVKEDSPRRVTTEGLRERKEEG